MSCGAENEANSLLDTLLEGKNFDVPTIDLSAIKLPTGNKIGELVPRVTVTDLTTKAVGGNGVFDVLLSTMRAHLREEYEKNRIIGPEYTKAYIGMFNACLAQATQFLLQKDQAFWQAQMAQVQAITAQVGIETAKVEYAKARIDASNTEAAFGLTKIKIANESATFCLQQDELTTLRPLQAANLTKQGDLIKEQMEAARGQTLDTRTDGAAIVGSVGKQKDLYNQQITSYKRDSELKVAKVFTDAWVAQKTVDEGLLPPTQFANTNLDTILAKLRLNNELN